METIEPFYENSQEHLHDELLMVDLMINAQVIKHRAAKQSINPLPGLYIRDEEIEELLQRNPGYSQWVNKPELVNEQYQIINTMIDSLHDLIKTKLHNARTRNIPLKLAELSQIYELNGRELQIFIICMAPEFDSKYGKLFGFLQDDVTKKAPTVELVLNLLCDTFGDKNKTRIHFTAQSKLFRYDLLEFIIAPAEPLKPLISKSIKANERIINYLLDDNRVDDDLFTMVTPVATAHTLETLALPEDIRTHFRDFIHYSGSTVPQNFIFSFYGPYGTEIQDMAAVICKAIGTTLLAVDLQAIYQSGLYFERCIDLLLRESRITKTALYLKNIDALFADSERNNYLKRYLLDQLNENSLLTFVSSREMLPLYGEFTRQKLIVVEIPLPAYDARKLLWETNLEPHQLSPEVDIHEIAGKYNLTAGQIHEVVSTAGVYAQWREPAAPVIGKKDIEEATHIHSNQRLGKLAKRIQPKHRWDDIILIEDIKEQLFELVKMFRYKHVVYNEWGFDKKLSLGKGISALFYGEPGTGKTLAAEIIAAELGMDLYTIDISSIVSKYVGETEKNLSRIFDEAESSNAILFFDEADAIFGKRTEVKDSHDRYSNIEVSYLLQRIDEYNGVVIMATNFHKNMDEAFERRLHYAINFPMPEEPARLQIWQRIYPADAPQADIDFALLAKKLKISGGHIKNIALQSAFYAADFHGDKRITMQLVKKACKAEFKKMGRLWDDKTLPG